MRYFPEAAEAFKSILVNSEEIMKKQIEESVLYLHKGII